MCAISLKSGRVPPVFPPIRSKQRQVSEAKDESEERAGEISDLQSQLRRADIEKRRAEDLIEMLRSDKSDLEEKVAKSRDDVDNTIRDYETKIDNITLK